MMLRKSLLRKGWMIVKFVRETLEFEMRSLKWSRCVGRRVL